MTEFRVGDLVKYDNPLEKFPPVFPLGTIYEVIKIHERIGIVEGVEYTQLLYLKITNDDSRYTRGFINSMFSLNKRYVVEQLDVL